MTDLAAKRRAYAARMMALAHVDDSRIEAAFARVPREAFAGPPPWTLYADREPAGDPADPASLDADVLIALDRAQGINNGSPLLHALMLHRLGLRPGARVLHAGVGGGYYTAILAELAGPVGSVTALEYDAPLADTARANLRAWPNVTVLQGDAAEPPGGPYDCIYINFAVVRPADRWLDLLNEGGTLVFPLGAPSGRGVPHSAAGSVLKITRIAGDFAVRFVSPCGFVMASGALAGDPGHLLAAFRRGGIEFVQSLRRAGAHGPPPPERAWFWTPAWSLSYDPPHAGFAA